MANEEKDEKKEEAAPPPKSKKKLFLSIGMVVLLIAAGAAFFLLKPKKEEKEELAADAAHSESDLTNETSVDPEEPLDEGEEALGAIFPLETFVVNLNGGKYVRVQMQFEFASRDIPKPFLGKLVVVRDAIIALLNKKTAENILAENGKDTVKIAVKDIVNETFRKEYVKKVYFTQFIVQ
jgi:flagellar FliL protein